MSHKHLENSGNNDTDIIKPLFNAVDLAAEGQNINIIYPYSSSCLSGTKEIINIFGNWINN